MANAFKRQSISSVSTSRQAVLASDVGASTEVVCIGMVASNKSTSATTITVEVSNGTNYYSYITDCPLPVASAVELLEGKLILGQDDNIEVTAGDASAVDFTLSYLEIT